MRPGTPSATTARRFIDELGALSQALPPSVDEQQLLDFYKALVLTRSFDKKCIALQRTGQMGTYPSCIGQEAIAVGVGKAMQGEDVFIPYYRDQGAQLARGVSMVEIMQYWGGDERGSNYQHCAQDLPNCVPIATQCSHAVGIASAIKIRHQAKAALCTLGDGGCAKGDFLESLNVCAIWKLPLVFLINNNQWAISTPGYLEHKIPQLSDLAVGAGLPGIRIDGNDVVAVYHAVTEALNEARAGKGPTLIEAVTYRLGDHTTADDASRYRDSEEVQAAWQREPIKRLQHFLHSQQLWQASDESQLLDECQRLVESAAQQYQALPPQPPEAMFDHLYATLPESLLQQRSQLVRRFPGKGGRSEYARKAQADSPEPAGANAPEPQQLTLVEAVTLALNHEMQRDDDIVLLGEDIGRNGGVFRATDGLQKTYGTRRVIDTPLAESLIAGIGVGMAIAQLKPVVEIQFMGFLYPAIDQLASHASRLRNRTRGRLSCPLVLRAPFGGGIHAPEHHSESTEAMLAHIPGLRVVIPSSPLRAYGLLLAAMRCPDPVVFLEPKRIYRSVKHPVADNGEALPLDRCFTLRLGRDLTLVCWGALVREALQAARQLAGEGIDVEVIDVATLKPLDSATIIASVKKTGRVLIAHEAARTFGAGAEIAAQLAEQALPFLKAPIKRVTGYDTIMPLMQMEHYYLPSTDDLVNAAHSLMQYSSAER
jgi:pyruvate dehydrogenase E1 component alpha subunit